MLFKDCDNAGGAQGILDNIKDLTAELAKGADADSDRVKELVSELNGQLGRSARGTVDTTPAFGEGKLTITVTITICTKRTFVLTFVFDVDTEWGIPPRAKSKRTIKIKLPDGTEITLEDYDSGWK